MPCYYIYIKVKRISSTLFGDTYIISSKTTKENPWMVNTRPSIAVTSVEKGGGFTFRERRRGSFMLLSGS